MKNLGLFQPFVTINYCEPFFVSDIKDWLKRLRVPSDTPVDFYFKSDPNPYHQIIKPASHRDHVFLKLDEDGFRFEQIIFSESKCSILNLSDLRKVIKPLEPSICYSAECGYTFCLLTLHQRIFDINGDNPYLLRIWAGDEEFDQEWKDEFLEIDKLRFK